MLQCKGQEKFSMEENIELNFDIPSDVLDEIQQNIEDIIQSFPIPDDNKLDVIKKINFMYSQTKYLSVTDALTGLYNRRHFESNFEREFLRADRYKSPLSIAMIDVDFFKKVNDTYGHGCGDYVLKEIAYLALQTFRKTDMVFRFGGEEFAVILTETGIQQAVIPCERLRKSVEEFPFKYNDQNIKVSISIGICEKTDEIKNSYKLFELADKALYTAKDNGRNQVQKG